MPIDRTAALRNAEKLLRQGKIDGAIAEYVRVVDDQPTDWNTANILGDLYARAGQIDRAVEQFTRIADSLSLEGFLPKAGALYKKILKLRPDDEHALVQAGEIAAGLGLFADARAYLTTVAERRRARGDSRGAAAARVRLGTLDPADFDRRIAASAARAELGELSEAVQDLKQIASELGAKDRHAEAVEALRQAVLLDPADENVRAQLLTFYIAAEDFSRAREYATTIEQLKGVADALDLRGRHDEALDTLRDAVWMAPDDLELKAHVARACIARGDSTGAAEFMTVEIAGDDSELLFLVAEVKLSAGTLDEGLAAVRRLLDVDPEAREQVASLGFTIAEETPDVGFRAVELATDAAVARGDWSWAAAALQEFSRRVPNCVQALTRLIELCVDGGLDEPMSHAQAQLADAYLAAGSASEAYVIAEDLLLRDPHDQANVERFRQALVLMNEPDPETIIAERSSRQSVFAPSDGSLETGPPPEVDAHRRADHSVELPSSHEPISDFEQDVPAPILRQPPQRHQTVDHQQFELSSNAIDIESILGELESRPSTVRATSESVEVDLSIVLNDIQPTARLTASDIDGAFGQLRNEASRRSASGAAEAAYTRALVLRQAGDINGCIEALQAACRAPDMRFAAASLLGRLFRERGMMTDAIEWLEQAAEAPAPAPADYHLVLYDLADGLEAVGETTRALAVCLELQSEAGPYRDVAARIERLGRVQARG